MALFIWVNCGLWIYRIIILNTSLTYSYLVTYFISDGGHDDILLAKILLLEYDLHFCNCSGFRLLRSSQGFHGNKIDMIFHTPGDFSP